MCAIYEDIVYDGIWKCLGENEVYGSSMVEYGGIW